MISTRVEKAEVLAKIIPIIDELEAWFRAHGDDVNGQYSQARYIKMRLVKVTDFATRLYRLCEFRGDSFVTIDIDSVGKYTTLSLENIRKDIEEYARLRAKITPPPVKPAVTIDDHMHANCAVWVSIIFVPIWLIYFFA